MSKIAALAVLMLGAFALAGCSLPGQAFPGGPSPWLPGGAPGTVLTPPATTTSSPASRAEAPATTGSIQQSATMGGHFESPASSMISSLLVVCTGNICRSPMAAALFAENARASGKLLEVASAGTQALVGHSPPPEVIELMAGRGLDISQHRARQITARLAQPFDLILVMERAQKQYIELSWPVFKGRVHRLGERNDGDVSDPYTGPPEAYAKSLDEIERGIEEWSGMLL